jgi:hypothetical protein
MATNLCSEAHCYACPLGGRIELGRVGLLWIGVQHYKTPEDFSSEAARMGVSRRLPGNMIPRGFEIGKTWVFLGHRKAISEICECRENGNETKDCPLCEGKGVIYKPGIFQIFRPTAIEQVVTGDEDDEEIEKIIKRGITPVKVLADKAQQEFFE